MSAPVSSMTGFGRSSGTLSGRAFTWELRSVNGRGLELRLKLPQGADAQEPRLRERAQAALKRGNVQASLTVQQETSAGPVIRTDVLDRLLELAKELAVRIPGAPPLRAEALLALPGVLRTSSEPESDLAALEAAAPAILAGFEAALAALVTARQAEGGRLAVVLIDQLDSIAGLTQAAARAAADQPEAQRRRLQDNLAALLQGATPGVSDDRLAQELALLASRSDVREELDRLASHVAAARALLAEGANIGRRLDFLVQEFNREANTLCSKSATTALTTIGLQLKATIEQLREQVQNIE